MKLANQQKVVIGVAVLAVITLIATTVWNRPKFAYQNPSDTERKAIQEAQQRQLEEYQKYLAEAKIDPVASRLILDQVIDKKQMGDQIRKEIGEGRPAFVPKVVESKFKITDDASKAAVEKYVNAVSIRLSGYYQKANTTWDSLFVADPDIVIADDVSRDVNATVQDLYNLEVPRVALDMHRAVIGGALVHQNFVDTTYKVAKGVAPRGNQWQEIMPTFVGSRQQLDTLNSSVQKLAAIYGDFAITLAPEEEAVQAFGGLVKVANAQVPVSVVTDLPRILEQFLRSALGTVVVNYIKDKFVASYKQIEQSFLIASYFDYHENLINVKYADQFLDKYLTDSSDKDMTKRFIPQFNCGRENEDDLKKQLKAKAIQYLGFDPSVPLDPADPDFYLKLSKTGDLRGDEYGYRMFYQALALVAGDEASAAASREEGFTGKKVPIDPKDKSIIQSLDSISGQQKAVANAMFNIAPINATTGGPGFSNFIVNSVFAVLQQLQVKGGSVIKEFKTCVKVPVFNPIVPGDFSPNSQQPSDALLQQCMANPQACENLIFSGVLNGDSVLPRGTPNSKGGTLAPPPPGGPRR